MIGTRARRGAAALEFAIVAPVLALLMLATADVVQLIRVYFRIERVAAEVANVTSQYERLRETDMGQILAAAQLIADDIQVTALSGRTIVSLVEGTTSGNRVRWQRATTGDPANQFASRIGTPPNAASLPTGMTMPVGQTLIVVEVFNRRSPWLLAADLLGGGPPDTLYAYFMTRPRAAQLGEILP